MKINDVAELVEVSASTLRYWEKKLDLDVPRGVCQGSCQVSHAADRSESGRFTGFKATVPMGVQLRVLPDQRSGFLALAAA